MKRMYLLLIIIVLTSCSILGEQPSILKDSSCEAPCWNGITVGITTGTEMFAILKKLPIVDQSIAVLNPWEIYDGGANFYLYPNGFFKHNVVVDSRFIKDKVANIGFCGDLGVSFGDVVEKTGDPNNIIFIPSPSGGLFVIAINQDIGVQFSYDTANMPKNLRTGISPEIQIDCLIYFAPEFYDEMLDAAEFSAGHLNAEQTLKAMYPWKGYGNLEEKYPPRQP